MAFKRAPPGTALGKKDAQLLKADAPIAGTKRWVDGSLLISTGHTQLDTYLGGGLPVGSTVLIEEDARNLHAPSLVRLFLGEAVASNQRVVVGGLESEASLRAFLESIPLNTSRGSKDTVVLEAIGATAATASEGAGADTESVWDVHGRQLNIAHQYKKYLAPDGGGGGAGSLGHTALGPSSKFGHTFDLNRCIPPAVLDAAHVHLLSAAAVADPWGEAGDSTAAEAVAEALLRGVRDALETHSADRDGSSSALGSAGSIGVTRIVLRDLGGPTWPGFSHDASFDGSGRLLSEDILQAYAPTLVLLRRLRQFVQGLGVEPQQAALPARRSGGAVLLVSAPTHLMPLGIAARLRNAFDCVIKLHAFDDPPGALATESTRIDGGAGGPARLVAASGAAPEYADYTGVLLLRRAPTKGLLVSRATQAACGHTFAFKHDRRRIVIDIPHLPPELPSAVPSTPAAATSNASVGVANKSAPRVSGGLSCATAGGVLDF